MIELTLAILFTIVSATAFIVYYGRQNTLLRLDNEYLTLRLKREKEAMDLLRQELSAARANTRHYNLQRAS